MRPSLLPVTLLLLASALAGCIGQPAAPGPIGAPGPVLPPLPTAGVLHGADGLRLALPAGFVPSVGGEFLTDARGTEPTIGVTKDQAVFTDGFKSSPSLCGQPQTCRSEPTVLRSTDHGQTWTDVGPALPSGDSTPPTTSDPIVYVDPATDRVFWLNQAETACATLFTSDDRGASWDPSPVSCGTPGLVDHVTIVAAKPRLLATLGYASVVYV
ncbi:MAG: hypothetical protein LC624_05705, partial [Halobacteriales archaeon]|nr:hypothetical protein [Halobacteriales archaeon]